MTRRSIAAFAAAMLGCGQAETAPVTYVLDRTAVDTLPYLLRQEDACRHMLRGGRVEFYEDGRYRSSYDVVKECPGARAVPMPVAGVDGRVTFRNDTAFFADSAGNVTGTGLLTADSLRVRGMLHTLIYVRQPHRR